MLRRVRAVSCRALVVCAVLTASAAFAWSPQNRPQREPAVPNFDGAITEAPFTGLTPHRRLGPAGTLGSLALSSIQSEMSIAVAGDTVVMGANDFRGATSTSGVYWSADGGATFHDGGQLSIGTGKNLYGDPALAVYTPAGGGPSVWYYASIFLNSLSRQSLCVHRSTDGGQTWAGPFEVTPANVLNHAADKEWIAVDPETGRLLVVWTDFPASGTNAMKVSYSDTQGATWSSAATVGTNGQGASIAVSSISNSVQIVWFGYSGSSTAIYGSRSTNNGTSWQGPTLLHTYSQVLPPYGFDRYNSYPSVAINPVNGDVVVVHAASQNGTTSGDLQDVSFCKSSDGGQTWSMPVALNAFPGSDRPQVFPTIACASNGREDVFWYDESAGSGNDDWTDLFYTYSTDFGVTWSSPVPVNSTPWHNESGNNFGAPHQGDYIDATTTTATLNAYAAAASFADPTAIGTGADPLSALVQNLGQVVPVRVRPGSVTFTDQGCTANDGFLVAGEVATLTVPLQNIGRSTLSNVSATLSARVDGVIILGGASAYPLGIVSGGSGNNLTPFSLKLDEGYPCGQDVKLRLDITAPGMASTYVEFALHTGVVASTTTLINETFDALTLPDLPAGWSRINGCASCAVLNWRSVADGTAPSAPNALFASDSTVSTFGRIYCPTFSIGGSATYVDVDFDVRYNTEAQDARTGFDGASFEYSVDGGGSHFATADAVEFTQRYDHYLTRNTGGTSNGDRQGWAGDSGGWKHVHLRIAGLANHTFQPRFSMASDQSVGASGVWVDNVLIKSVTMGCGSCTPTAIAEHPQSDATVLQLRAVGAVPFVGATAIAFTLPRRGDVRLDVFNLAGEKVRTLMSGSRNAGTYAVPFALRAPGAAALPAGIYVVRLSAAGRVSTMRVTALR